MVDPASLWILSFLFRASLFGPQPVWLFSLGSAPRIYSVIVLNDLVASCKAAGMRGKQKKSAPFNRKKQKHKNIHLFTQDFWAKQITLDFWGKNISYLAFFNSTQLIFMVRNVYNVCQCDAEWSSQQTSNFVRKFLHPWRLTWNIIMEVWKIIFLSKWVICRFHVNLPWCTHVVLPNSKRGVFGWFPTIPGVEIQHLKSSNFHLVNVVGGWTNPMRKICPSKMGSSSPGLWGGNNTCLRKSLLPPSSC